MTEIEQYHQKSAPVVPQAGGTGANLIREAAAAMADAHALAKAIAGTQMVPKHFQHKPDECAAAMLYGASLGLDPMQSVKQIYVVHGQAALYARGMQALVNGAGHQTWTVETSDESVTVAGRRKGNEHVEQSTWTYERAKKAGYTNNEKYRTDPQAMLYSKAVSEVCRKIAPDVLSGIYSVEEMQLERIESEQVGIRRGGLSAALQNSSPAPDHARSETPAARNTAVEASAGEDQPEPLTERTRKAMFALFAEVGLPDKQSQLDYIGDVLGRTFDSRAELTEEDGLRVEAALRAEPVDAETTEADQ